MTYFLLMKIGLILSPIAYFFGKKYFTLKRKLEENETIIATQRKIDVIFSRPPDSADNLLERMRRDK